MKKLRLENYFAFKNFEKGNHFCALNLGTLTYTLNP